MAFTCIYRPFSVFPFSRSSYLSRKFYFKPLNPQFTSQPPRSSLFCSAHSRTFSSKGANFTWDDVLREAQVDAKPSDLAGFFEKISACNRNPEKQCEFIPFVLEDQIIGYIHNGLADALGRFEDVFLFQCSHNDSSNDYITLRETLKTAEERTFAIEYVIKSLGADMIPGIRNELYPVTTCFGGKELFGLERAAAPYFGIKAYGVHMNGYVEQNGEKFLWVGKRSLIKPTYPGMLDHLVAGGLPCGITSRDCMIKECQEEAGIPEHISSKVRAVGAVSYADVDGSRYKRDVLFCYDLKLPADFVPCSQDGEVESFKLIPIGQVANIIKQTELFKPNCCLVIIDFLVRHGYITPDDPGYLKLLQRLRSGDCL